MPIEQGGITDTYDGRITYEEYPAQPAPHVLNGMIFALFGLWDLVRAQPDDARAAAIFERGAATVEALLPLYDTGWWSLYDLYHLEAASPRNPCTAHYHDIHIKQLTVMHAITGRDAVRRVRPPLGRLPGRDARGVFAPTPRRRCSSRGASWAEPKPARAGDSRKCLPRSGLRVLVWWRTASPSSLRPSDARRPWLWLLRIALRHTRLRLPEPLGGTDVL